MPLITAIEPENWQELEVGVTEILAECGMQSQRQLHMPLPRGGADLDVYAVDEVNGIRTTIICECKHWDTNVPQHVAQAFRTVMGEAGANRGYIISKRGFQEGAYRTVGNTNIELLTYRGFQELYFQRWYEKQIWRMERAVGSINTYYELFGIPGIDRLEEAEANAYLEVWRRLRFIGALLPAFSPYMLGHGHVPPNLPLNVEGLDRNNYAVPDDVRNATGYREVIALLTTYASEGLAELRSHNPLTKGIDAAEVERDD